MFFFSVGHVRLEDKKQNFVGKFMIIIIRLGKIRFYSYQQQELLKYDEPLGEPDDEFNFSQITEVFHFFIVRRRWILF